MNKGFVCPMQLPKILYLIESGASLRLLFIITAPRIGVRAMFDRGALVRRRSS